MGTKQNIYSGAALVIIFAAILSVFTFNNLWQQNRITLDVPSYYTYLPAAIIYHDLELNFIDSQPEYFEDKIWFYRIEDGKKLIKHPMGISVALSPFFLTGHVIAQITNVTEDGYSLTYQNAVTIGVFIYLFIGLYYLRKILLEFFSDKIVSLTLTSIVLGTNLLWYSTFELLMPHAISFSVISICLYTFFKWLSTEKAKYLYPFAIAFGLSVLIRQLSITLLVFFLIYALISKGGLKNFMEFFREHIKFIISAAFISIIIASLQLFYWKYVTGSWFYDPYVGEHFVFFENKMLPFLFGFRKGLFIYFPVLIFFIIGLIYFLKYNKALFYSSLIIFLLAVFIFSSWWAWSYGISWGVRPMIDYYPIMSLSVAAGFHYFYDSRFLKLLFLTLVPLFICLNLFQTWQYKNELIHYDNMTREAYFKGFLKTSSSLEWYDSLKPYDWNRRKNRLPQIKYSKELILNTGKQVYLKGSNLLYLSVNPRAQNAVAAYTGNIDDNSLFIVERINNNTVAIRAGNGFYLSIQSEYDNIITATGRMPGEREMFILEYINEGNNLIAFKSMNDKYLSINENFPYTLHANKNTRGRNETFRIFIHQ